MSYESGKDVVPKTPVWNPPSLDFPRTKPPIKYEDRRSINSLDSLVSQVVPENVHTGVCQIKQGCYGYDVGLHWRILAAILYGIYTWFPLNTTSRIVGKLSRVPLPRVLRGPVVRAYAWIFSARLEEAEFHNDLARYNSISHFFRRRLVPSARPVDPSACLTSPADGKVISCGRVEEGHLEQVKGLAYTLRALLGPHALLERRADAGAAGCGADPVGGGRLRRVATLPSRLDSLGREGAPPVTAVRGRKTPEVNATGEGGETGSAEMMDLYHCAIYLAPGDYHCFHSPADWKIDMRRHFPGRLFSVCSLVTSWLNGVFCINERAVYMGQWVHGFFAFVAVGATNVGSIHVFADPDLVTNRQPSYLRHLFTSRRGVKVDGEAASSGAFSNAERGSMPIIVKMDGYEDVHFVQPLQSAKGELFGEFNFGSTIVLIFEAPTNFEFLVKKSERVRVGQALGRVVSG